MRRKSPLQRNVAGPSPLRVRKTRKTITAMTGRHHPYLRLVNGGQPRRLDHDPNPSLGLLLLLQMLQICSTTTTTNHKQHRRCRARPPGLNRKCEKKKLTMDTRSKDRLRESRLDLSRRHGKWRRMSMEKLSHGSRRDRGRNQRLRRRYGHRPARSLNLSHPQTTRRPMMGGLSLPSRRHLPLLLLVQGQSRCHGRRGKPKRRMWVNQL